MPPIENVVLFLIVIVFAGWFLYSFVNTPIPMHEDEAFFKQWDEMLEERVETDVLIAKLFISVDAYLQYRREHEMEPTLSNASQFIRVAKEANELIDEMEANLNALKKNGFHHARYIFSSDSTK